MIRSNMGLLEDPMGDQNEIRAVKNFFMTFLAFELSFWTFCPMVFLLLEEWIKANVGGDNWAGRWSEGAPLAAGAGASSAVGAGPGLLWKVRTWVFQVGE